MLRYWRAPTGASDLPGASDLADCWDGPVPPGQEAGR